MGRHLHKDGGPQRQRQPRHRVVEGSKAGQRPAQRVVVKVQVEGAAGGQRDQPGAKVCQQCNGGQQVEAQGP
jgi:hypothetical protein